MFEKQPSIYVAYCIVVDSIYIHYTLYFYHMGLNNLFMRQISLCVIIVGQTPSSKIAIVDQPFFILQFYKVITHILRVYQIRFG